MNNLKTLISFTYPHEAHIAKGYLESNGIVVFLKDEMTIQVNNFYSNAIGGVKLLVKISDYDNGLQLLKDSGYITENKAKATFKLPVIKFNSTVNEEVCPFCKSENIAKNKRINILIIPVYLLIGLIFPIFNSNYKCFDCENEWKYKKDKR